MAEKDPFAAYVVEPEKPVQPIQPAKPATQADPFAAYVVPSQEQTDPFAKYAVGMEPDEEHYQKLKKEQTAYGIGDLVTEQAAEARGGRVLTKTTSNRDIAAIAKHHQVPSEELRDVAPYFMALPPMDEATLTDYLKRYAVGAVGYGVLGDIPQFLYKKLQDPKMRAALDDVRDLAEGRMGAAEFVGFNFLPTPKVKAIVAAVTAPEKLVPALTKGAAIGAAYGLAGSREGEELEGTTLGAVTGGALGGAALGGKKLIDNIRGGKVTPDATGKAAGRTTDPETLRISEEYVKNNESKIIEVTDQAWSRIEDSEKDIADAAVKKASLSDDQVERIINDQLSPDSVEVAKKNLSEKLEREVTDRDVVEELVSQRREAFAKRLATEIPALGEPVKVGRGQQDFRPPTVDEIFQRASGQGEEFLTKKFLGESYTRTGMEQIDKLHIKANPDAAPVGKMLVNAMSDRQFVIKTIDEIRGTNLLPHFYDLMTNYNHFTIEKSLNEKKVANLFKLGRKANLVRDLSDSEIGGQVFRAMDNNADDTLTGPARELAKEFRAFWDMMPERANTMQGAGVSPLNIQKRADFGVPNIPVTPVEYVIRMKKKMKEVDTDLRAKMGKGLADIISKEDYDAAMSASSAMRELEGGTKLMYQAPIQDGTTLQLALQDVTQRGASNPRLHAVAFTTMQRKDTIPDFLREKNLFKVSKRYAENTMRNVYLREPLEKLTQQARLLRAAKADTDAAYVERLVADNLGIRAMSMARLGNEARIKFAEALERGMETIVPNPEKRKVVVDTLRIIPELMANIQYNIYPNVLGMNPRAHLAQLTQTWFKNAPELGGRYGYELTTKSFLQGVLVLRDKEARQLFYSKVRQYGLEPESFIREASEATAEEMERHLLYNVPAKVVREAANLFMKTYGKMDTFNRGVTAYMGERLAFDLNSGVKGAFDAVNKMPISIRRALVKEKGNVAAQAEILAKHLNSTTQFNYNRAAMSELGILAGPFFSTFTKWPLATAGDIIADLRTKGFQSGGLRAAEKYGTVLLLASVVDNAIRYGLGGELDIGGDFADYDDRVKKVLGSSGFVGMAPISSAAALVPGAREKSLFTPPVVDALYNGILSPMMTGDTEQLLKQGEKTVKTFIPGGFVWRFLTEDIPLWTTGEKPE